MWASRSPSRRFCRRLHVGLLPRASGPRRPRPPRSGRRARGSPSRAPSRDRAAVRCRTTRAPGRRRPRATSACRGAARTGVRPPSEGRPRARAIAGPSRNQCSTAMWCCSRGMNPTRPPRTRVTAPTTSASTGASASRVRFRPLCLGASASRPRASRAAWVRADSRPRRARGTTSSRSEQRGRRSELASRRLLRAQSGGGSAAATRGRCPVAAGRADSGRR